MTMIELAHFPSTRSVRNARTWLDLWSYSIYRACFYQSHETKQESKNEECFWKFSSWKDFYRNVIQLDRRQSTILNSANLTDHFYLQTFTACYRECKRLIFYFHVHTCCCCYFIFLLDLLSWAQNTNSFDSASHLESLVLEIQQNSCNSSRQQYA
jgi:hypothetical protein